MNPSAAAPTPVAAAVSSPPTRPRRRAHRAGALLLVATVASLLGGCKSDSPAAPATTQATRTGSISLTVTGLPAGAPGDVLVQGPSTFSRTVTGTTTLGELEPGTYSIDAHEITASGTIYTPTPASQSAVVAASATPVSAGVKYVATTGSLAIAISGLPSGASASVTVTGPNSYSQTVTTTGTLTTLRAGTYTIDAAPVTVGGTVYAPTIASPDVTVAAGATGNAAVSYARQQQTSADLSVAGLYLVQSVQKLDRSVPLVSGRNAVLRVFVRADRPLDATPSVRVKLFRSGQLVRTLIVAAPLASVPTGAAEASEGSVLSSWNVVVPGALVTPGLSVRADVDPYDAYGETDETDNAYPASGAAAVAVQTAPTYRVRFIPVSQGGLAVGNVTPSNVEQYLEATRKMHPVNTIDADIGVPYTVSYKLTSDNNDGTWSRLLGEIDTKRVAEGTGRDYYGVVQVSYTSGIAGLGYMPGHSAIGWHYLANGRASEVMAHEVGHNFSLQHTPCGGPADPDPAYPYPGGVTGVYGFDVTAGPYGPTAIKAPTMYDLMGYCTGKWISDYDYKKVLRFRAGGSAVQGSAGGALAAETAAAADDASAAAAAEPCLLVWGRVVNGEPVLEPAFVVTTRPSRPRGSGALTLRATSASGATLWSRSFAGSLIADTPAGDRAFSFAIPLREIRAQSVAALRLEARGRVATTRVEADAAADGNGGGVRVTREAAGTGLLRLRWDAARHPVLMVRDARTGTVLSFARGGDATVRSSAAAGGADEAVDVTLPNRVQNAWHRLRVGGAQ